MPTTIAYAIALPHATETVPPIEGCFSMPGETVSLSALRAAFPFEGAFHYRARLNVPEGEYVWIDLTTGDETVPLSDSGVGIIRALPLFDVAPLAGAAGEFDALPAQYEAWRQRRSEELRAPLPAAAGRAGAEAAGVDGLGENSAPAAGAPVAMRMSSFFGQPPSAASASIEWSDGGGGSGGGDGSRDEPAPPAARRSTAASSIATGSSGGSIFKGLLNAAAKGLSDVGSAAVSAAKKVEKKGWFSTLKKNFLGGESAAAGAPVDAARFEDGADEGDGRDDGDEQADGSSGTHPRAIAANVDFDWR